MSGRWRVQASENFGAPGEGDVYSLGTFECQIQARSSAREHVRSSLRDFVLGAVSVSDLIQGYRCAGESVVIWGEDPFEMVDFYGYDYAHQIAGEVFSDYHESAVDARLRQAYRQTDYIAFLPLGEALIRVGEASQVIDDWLTAWKVRSAIFLSASNPMSRALSESENSERHAQLVELACRNEWPTAAGVGRSRMGDWAEASLLIGGVSAVEARKMARQYEQAGFLWLQHGMAASLRIRTMADYWVEESDLAA